MDYPLDFERLSGLDELGETVRLRLEAYSEKALVLRGDTKPYKDEIGRKGLGGKFNGRLRGGPGWVFRKEDRERVEKWMGFFGRVGQGSFTPGLSQNRT